MPTLFPEKVSLPNGPLSRSPSELLAAYRAGAQHEDHMVLVLLLVAALVLLTMAVAMFFVVRGRREGSSSA
eukprot:s5519_g1.t1